MAETPKFATIGMFDGVHRGHRRLIDCLKSEAVARGMEAAVFTFDRHPLSVIAPGKAPASLMTVADKVAAIRQTGVETVEVLEFDEALRALTALEFLELLRDRFGVRALMMGFNHRFGSDRLSDLADYEAVGRRLGVEIVRADELRDADAAGTISSSAIRRALSAGDVADANRMLGYNYRLRGNVVSGKQLGRTIGFPTANISISGCGLLIPGKGVYAVDVTVGDSDERHRGMLNIGHRPTVDTSSAPALSVEVHIIDWTGDLYGKEIAVEFIGRIRDEMRFSDLDALKRRLSQDRNCAINLSKSLI